MSSNQEPIADVCYILGILGVFSWISYRSHPRKIVVKMSRFVAFHIGRTLEDLFRKLNLPKLYFFPNRPLIRPSTSKLKVIMKHGYLAACCLIESKETNKWTDIEEIAMHTLGTFAIVIPAPVKIPNISTFNLVEFRRF